MENTLLPIAPIQPIKEKLKGFSLPFYFLLSILLFQEAAYAQIGSGTNKCIDNNKIELVAPICTGYKMLLKGTLPKGGTGVFAYKWEVNPNGNCGENGFAEIPGANRPDYHVPITADPNSCYRRIVISGDCSEESNKLNVSDRSIPSPVLPTIDITQPTCTLPTGVIKVNPPASAVGFSIDGIDFSNTSGVFGGLPPNTYTVTVRYATGCTASVSAKVEVPPAAPNGNISPGKAMICEGGSQLLTAAGGTSYQWYKDDVIINGATTATYSATMAGTYSVDVIKEGCRAKATNTATVNIEETPRGTISPETATICNGNNINLTAYGGDSYQWYRNGVAISGAVSASYTVTQAGTYTVELVRGDCKAKASNQAIISVSTNLSGNISPSTAAICNNTSIKLTATGGATYQWFKDGQPINGAITNTYTATEAGTYTADLISGNCKGRAGNSAVITKGTTLSGAITPATASLCGNTPVVLTISGGDRYQWYRNGVAISGANGATLSVSKTGIYSADILGAGGCKGKSSNQVEVISVDLPTGSISPASVSLCGGGAVTISATGGTTYQWYKDNVLIQGATQSTYNVTAPGTYTADIINGTCKGRATNEVIATKSNKPSGTISPAKASICASGGTVLLTATGGSSYQWFKDDAALSGAKAATYNATSPGQYSVTIKNGSCSGPASNTVIISQSPTITFNTSVTDPGCTITTGTIAIKTVIGGSGAGYQYSKDGGITYQSENTFTGLHPGQYKIVVKDANGCKSVTQVVTIKQAVKAPSATVAINDIGCGQSNGTATINVTGGQPPYVYSLNGAADQPDNVFKDLAAGSYKVLIKDAGGCSTEVSFAIKKVNSTLNATAIVKNPTCNQTSGSVTIITQNGTPSYQFSLDKGPYQANALFENVDIGKHTVTVKDDAGCTFDVVFEIKATSTIPNLVITNPTPLCSGASANLKAAAVTAGSDLGLTLTYWVNADASIALDNPEEVSIGTYYIKAVNNAGCFNIKPVVVSQDNTPAGAITPANPAIVCSGDSVLLTASSGGSYQWYKDDKVISGATNASYKATEEGRYSVLIYNGACAIRAANTVTLRFQACIPAIETKVFVPTAFTPNRNSKNDLLQPYLLNVRKLVLFKVFNRWGQLVYQTSVIGEGWDGTIKGVPQPTETYGWLLECVDFDGKVIKQSGHSLLIR